ncbi:MAG: hypothetical protein R3F55_04855 [Alphaproteobacteria bacterium]
MENAPRHVALAELRARIARIEGPEAAANGGGTLRLGVAGIDRRLPGGGLQFGCLHEVVGPVEGAGTGFVVHLLRRLVAGEAAAGRGDRPGDGGPVFWCAPEPGLHAPGLAGRGLDIDRLILVEAPRREDRLWAMEECLRCRGVAAVVGEFRVRDGIDLTASRRLQLAAGQGGAIALLLRPPPPRPPSRPPSRQGMAAADDDDAAPVSALGASAAVTRWRVRPAPPPGDDAGFDAEKGARAGIGSDDDGGDDGGGDDMGRRSRWRLALTRSRSGACRQWTVEVDHATGDLAVVAPLRDGAGAALPCGWEKRRGPTLRSAAAG